MTCPYCHLYHAIRQACEVCGANVPKDTANDQPIAIRKQLKPIAPVAKPIMSPRISNILLRLRQAGMASDESIVNGLRIGAVSQVLGFKLEYEYMIDYLAGKGYSVENYRYRVVCGSAETEYGQQAA